MATVRIPTPLRKLTNGQEEVKATGATSPRSHHQPGDAVPRATERICDDQGKVRRFVNIFKNDEDIRFLQNLDTPVRRPTSCPSFRPSPAAEGCLVVADAGRDPTLRPPDRPARGRGRTARRACCAAEVVVVGAATRADAGRPPTTCGRPAWAGSTVRRRRPRRPMRRGLAGSAAGRARSLVLRFGLRRRCAAAGGGAAGRPGAGRMRGRRRRASTCSSFRRHGPCPHAALDVPPRRGCRRRPRAGAAGGAGRAPWRPARRCGCWSLPQAPPRARLLRLPAGARRPPTQRAGDALGARVFPAAAGSSPEANLA